MTHSTPSCGNGSAESRFALVAESDAPVRKLLNTLLVRGGFSVLSAASGKEAISVAASASVPFSVAIIETELPDMRGTALARRLVSLQPGLPVLFVGADAQDEGSLSEPPRPLLLKPFHPEQFLRMVEGAASRRISRH